MSRFGQIAFEMEQIAVDHPTNPVVVAGEPIAAGFEQLHHDLRIGLAVEADVLDRCRTDRRLLGQGSQNRTPPRSAGEQQSTVDVKEHQALRHEVASGLASAQARQTVTP